MGMAEGPFRILVVEDHLEMRRFMADFCEVNGYEVDFAFNGEQGLQLMETRKPYGAAVVDFLMPRMHGLDFVRLARSRSSDLPIIAMSAFDDVEDAFIQAGANVFLMKPFDPYSLEKEIELIARSRA